MNNDENNDEKATKGVAILQRWLQQNGSTSYHCTYFGNTVTATAYFDVSKPVMELRELLGQSGIYIDNIGLSFFKDKLEIKMHTYVDKILDHVESEIKPTRHGGEMKKIFMIVSLCLLTVIVLIQTMSFITLRDMKRSVDNIKWRIDPPINFHNLSELHIPDSFTLTPQGE